MQTQVIFSNKIRKLAQLVAKNFLKHKDSMKQDCGFAQ